MYAMFKPVFDRHFCPEEVKIFILCSSIFKPKPLHLFLFVDLFRQSDVISKLNISLNFSLWIFNYSISPKRKVALIVLGSLLVNDLWTLACPSRSARPRKCRNL